MAWRKGFIGEIVKTGEWGGVGWLSSLASRLSPFLFTHAHLREPSRFPPDNRQGGQAAKRIGDGHGKPDGEFVVGEEVGEDPDARQEADYLAEEGEKYSNVRTPDGLIEGGGDNVYAD